jgi:hypothetical protein
VELPSDSHDRYVSADDGEHHHQHHQQHVVASSAIGGPNILSTICRLFIAIFCGSFLCLGTSAGWRLCEIVVFGI